MKDNKLIADFMGLETPDGVYYEHLENEERSQLTHFVLLKYHTSWDWLMPILEKIEQLNEGVPKQLIHLSLFSTIDEVYEAVVEFIKQHNDER